MSLTKVQLGVTALLLAGAATTVVFQQRAQNSLHRENDSLREEIAQLHTNRGPAANHGNRPTGALTLSLPAPQMTTSTAPSDSLPDPGSTNLIVRLQHGEKAPSLTTEQAESYLNENHRSAASLLAAFRATGDRKLLDEAMQKFPNDPQVALTAAYAPDTPPEERRRWLDAFKQAAPDNSLANYLSAFDHFKGGRRELAIQDLNAAANKPSLQDYSWEFVENGVEAYRDAGYSEVEARMIPQMAQLLPHLWELKQLNFDMVNLANAYRQAGDETSAQAALQMDATLGQRLSGSGSTTLVTQLVGMAIETIALKQMDPTIPYGSSGQTVQEHLNQLTQRRTTLTDFSTRLDAIYETISPADWISYHDRWYGAGEESAMRWLLDKYARK